MFYSLHWREKMNADQKSALLGFLSYIWIITIMMIIHFCYENLQIRFENSRIIFSLFSLGWFLLSLLWSREDPRNKIIKNILLTWEIYLILLMIIKPILNFSHWEFLLFYLSGVWIYTSRFDYIPISKYLKLGISLSILIFMLSIEIFMIYRTPLDLNSFYQSRTYRLYYFSEKPDQNSYLLINRSSENQEKKRTKNQTFSFVLPYTANQKISYSLFKSSKNTTEKSILVIQDPSWDIFRLLPQSEIRFSTLNNNLDYLIIKGNLQKIWLNTTTIYQNIFHLQNNYKEQLWYEIKKNIPLLILSNQNLQNISLKYTKWLASWNPFYAHNEKIANEYQNFFNMKNLWKTNKSKYRETLNDNYNFWLKWVMWKTQLFHFSQSSFFNFFHKVF